MEGLRGGHQRRAEHGVRAVSDQEFCRAVLDQIPRATAAEREDICRELMEHLEDHREALMEGGLDEADRLSDPRDILRYCWFAALYVDMAGAEDEVGYVVEGEGDWGEPVGFAVKGDRVTYVGPDYLEAMENPY